MYVLLLVVPFPRLASESLLIDLDRRPYLATLFIN